MANSKNYIQISSLSLHTKPSFLNLTISAKFFCYLSGRWYFCIL